MLQITPIKAFDDNYIWALRNPGASTAVAVDPGDETPLLDWLQENSLTLSAVLLTHHHYDHVGGVPELREAFPDLKVFGPAGESIKGVTEPLHEGDRPLIPGLDADFQVLELPGHTAGHIAYLGEQALFCGDTLFAAGCGRVFDGTMTQLANSLQRIAQLPAETKIYCAHEYTLDNLGFARWVEPESEAVMQRIDSEQAKRQNGEPTLPSTLQLELATNPFLRTQVPSIVTAAEKVAGKTLTDHAEIFMVIRQWKDREYD
ncbi:MAG: hydroxyacylglutathione hydrolase [Candidatus Thiodiazotropha lotti]|uniref:hydroxyacylglutathione hydrolase n=1 Tax=Candidatus Thiodiazotropha endoloripes TaxID=1818881 RepID=UPI00083DB98B|nr:hydroxyacylglutathione hydrolase [Candidatus Thiodiazotropha endoloripes]MCG7900955.1 hydroxyacylglutathione hydrolase [Candidatus Thiodiazotropha weberae]MCG7992603.1 hydroxyacylglutathione hydrolase [Candidatus Thiodiazotropha lotti]MCG7914240.1 hydroxyacylglutathione hydrolase [Candidatus Thiodiazotropha weberae]MCG8000044.1 hydroxyacylglutathione hydrolase [Candidatus Thiodiazotropha lotti]MCW4184263.1 hydroxyacylglutathione hydrolase [Candidatus Thiodiazotropha weberae]